MMCSELAVPSFRSMQIRFDIVGLEVVAILNTEIIITLLYSY